MLGRAGGAHAANGLRPLLQALFFEAHAKQERVITAEHLEAAAARVGDPVDESTHLGHAVELHAGEIARAADQLLRLLGELREAAAEAVARSAQRSSRVRAQTGEQVVTASLSVTGARKRRAPAPTKAEAFTATSRLTS